MQFSISDFEDKYLRLKILIIEVATEIHHQKREEFSADRLESFIGHEEPTTPATTKMTTTTTRNKRTNKRKMTIDSDDVGFGTSVFYDADFSPMTSPRCAENAATTPELIVVNAAGIPCIPRDLFYRIVDGILPVKEMEMLLLAKFVCFLAVILYVMMLLGVFEDFQTSVTSERSLVFGETAMSACLLLLPMFLAAFRERAKTVLEKIRRRFIVRRLIEDYLKENEFFYAY